MSAALSRWARSLIAGLAAPELVQVLQAQLQPAAPLAAAAALSSARPSARQPVRRLQGVRA